MPGLIVNGSKIGVRLVEAELMKLRLDPENPRLHSAYLTHELSSNPSQKQLHEALSRLPEFESLVDSLAHNNGCFHAPLVSEDLRVLEGNRRVAAMRRLHAEHPKASRWQKVTVQQIVGRITVAQEKAIRAKCHLEGMLPWDGLSQLAEYTAVAEREGADRLATMLERHRVQIEPLLVAGRCMRAFSARYPDVRSAEALWVLAGLCGVKQIEPQVAFSRTTRCIFTEDDGERPQRQPYSTAKLFQWIAEGRFTRTHEEDGRVYHVKPARVPTVFRQVREAGEEAFCYFVEPEGSLARALASIEREQHTPNRQQVRALSLTHKYNELLGQIKTIRREESPELYRDATMTYHRLGQLLGLDRKERTDVQAARA